MNVHSSRRYVCGLENDKYFCCSLARAVDQEVYESNKIKRLFLPIHFSLRQSISQVISSKKMSNYGFRLQTPQRTITSFSESATKEPQLGFSTVIYSQIGNHQDPSYGSMGNVCSPRPLCCACTHEFHNLVAGSGKSTLLYVVYRLLRFNSFT